MANTLDKQEYLNPIIYSNNPDKQMQSTHGCPYATCIQNGSSSTQQSFLDSLIEEEEGQHFNSTENREHILQTPEVNHSHHLILESKILEYLTKDVLERSREIHCARQTLCQTDGRTYIKIFSFSYKRTCEMLSANIHHSPFCDSMQVSRLGW